MSKGNGPTYDFLLVAIGLITGFFLGAGIIYWYTNQPPDHQITDQALERIARLFGTEDDEREHTQPKSGNTKIIHAPIAEKTASLENLAPDNEDTILLSEIDSLHMDHTFANTDSISSDQVNEDITYSLIVGTTDSDTILEFLPVRPPQETIRIARDRLIGTKAYTIPMPKNPTASQSEGSRRLDSLIGGRQTPNQTYRIIYVEFWESPLNYTNYKMGPNRILLYGINQFDEVSLHIVDATLYLRSFNNYYQLAYATEFKPLIPITNQELITKLELSWP